MSASGPLVSCLCVHIILLICVRNDFRIRNASFMKYQLKNMFHTDVTIFCGEINGN